MRVASVLCMAALAASIITPSTTRAEDEREIPVRIEPHLPQGWTVEGDWEREKVVTVFGNGHDVMKIGEAVIKTTPEEEQDKVKMFMNTRGVKHLFRLRGKGSSLVVDFYRLMDGASVVIAIKTFVLDPSRGVRIVAALEPDRLPTTGITVMETVLGTTARLE